MTARPTHRRMLNQRCCRPKNIGTPTERLTDHLRFGNQRTSTLIPRWFLTPIRSVHGPLRSVRSIGSVRRNYLSIHVRRWPTKNPPKFRSAAGGSRPELARVPKVPHRRKLTRRLFRASWKLPRRFHLGTRTATPIHPTRIPTRTLSRTSTQIPLTPTTCSPLGSPRAHAAWPPTANWLSAAAARAPRLARDGGLPRNSSIALRSSSVAVASLTGKSNALS